MKPGQGRRHPSIKLFFWSLLFLLLMGGMGWGQTGKPGPSQDQAILYRRAVSLLEKAEQKLNVRALAEAKTASKEANALFTILQKSHAPLLAERLLTPREEQQFAINAKLAADVRAQAERLMETAAANDQKGRELEAQKQDDQAKHHFRQAKAEYDQAQYFFIKAEIFSLRNQQMIFRFLAP